MAGLDPPRPPRSAAARVSPPHLSQKLLNLGLQPLDFGVDLRKGPWWHVPVEVPGQGDLEADLGAGMIHPCVGHVRQYLVTHVVVDGGPVCQRREASRGVLNERQRY